jgi:hypothetical protein
VNKGTSYLLLQNLKGWSPAQFEHLCAYLHFCPYVREKIFKEIYLGRVAGPFDYPPMPTFRVSPIFLVRKKNDDLRLIHNLSYPTQYSVNDYIDPELCTVRY